jgi:hypothetical protein
MIDCVIRQGVTEAVKDSLGELNGHNDAPSVRPLVHEKRTGFRQVQLRNRCASLMHSQEQSGPTDDRFLAVL